MNFAKRSLWLLAGAVLLISAAALAQDESADAFDWLRTEWQLVAFGDGDAQTPVIEGSSITLKFSGENGVSGTGGCNSYGGGYRLNGESIMFGDLIRTEMACLEPDLMTQESAFFEALGAVNRYELDEDRLILYGADGQQLIFKPLPKLEDERWQLVAYGAADDPSEVIRGPLLTLHFDGEGGVYGFGGCTNFRALYSVDGRALTFEEVFSPRANCGESFGPQEAMYFAALESTTGYAQTDDQLILFYGSGEQLVFEAVRTLEGALWTLSSFVDGDSVSSVLADSEITLTFDAINNSIGGSGGCNSYGGSYAVEGDSITFSQLVSTMIACMDDGVMTQESTYLAALESVERYEVTGRQLTLFYGDGQQLIFDRVLSGQPQ